MFFVVNTPPIILVYGILSVKSAKKAIKHKIDMVTALHYPSAIKASMTRQCPITLVSDGIVLIKHIIATSDLID